MLINSLIIIGFLLSFMCFVCFFVSGRYLSNKTIGTLFLDSILIILSIGAFSTGFFLRDSYLKAGRNNGTGQERGQSISVGEEAEPSYTPSEFTYPKTGGEEGEKKITDMNRSDMDTEEKPESENEKVPDGIRQETGTVAGSSQPEREPQSSAEPSAEAMPPSDGEPQPGTESSVEAEIPVSTETAVSPETPVEQAPPANVETPPEMVKPEEMGTPESEISQEMEGDLNGGQGDMAQPDQEEVQAPNPEETGQ